MKRKKKKKRAEDPSGHWWRGGTMALVLTAPTSLNVGMQVQKVALCHSYTDAFLTLLPPVISEVFRKTMVVRQEMSWFSNSARSKWEISECTTVFRPPGGSTIKARQTVNRTRYHSQEVWLCIGKNVPVVSNTFYYFFKCLFFLFNYWLILHAEAPIFFFFFKCSNLHESLSLVVRGSHVDILTLF